MTKKDYERIAAAMNAVGRTARGKDERAQWVLDCCAVANALVGTNPRFDRARFLKACGVEG